jgi:hypothetical protein
LNNTLLAGDTSAKETKAAIGQNFIRALIIGAIPRTVISQTWSALLVWREAMMTIYMKEFKTLPIVWSRRYFLKVLPQSVRSSPAGSADPFRFVAVIYKIFLV